MVRGSTALILVCLVGCNKSTSAHANVTVLLGLAKNMNNHCVGHAAGLCGTEDEMLPTEIAGVFATEPDCQGIRLRGLIEKERSTPSNQLPLLLDVYYEGNRSEPYSGTGKNETEGWMFTFNGPRGFFSGKARTEHEMVSRVCKAAKGLGADIDPSVGYSK
jgi:hypothetical protein